MAVIQTSRSALRTALLTSPSLVRWGIGIDTAPAWVWPLLLAAALWPSWLWMGQRMLDRSDDPLGLLALAALAVLLWQHRQHLRAAPRLPWFAAALSAAVLATALQGVLPALLVALLATLGMAAGLAAVLPPRVAAAPVLGLSVLSLPLLASLQFYAGYPLRLLTAESSRWLLMAKHTVERQGSSLLVDGQLIMVDAPCSGVQMAWLGYFTACAASLYLARSNRSFLSRLPAVSLLVLAGNIVRNTLLVSAEASGRELPAWTHEALGLLTLAVVCGSIALVMAAHPKTKDSHVREHLCQPRPAQDPVGRPAARLHAVFGHQHQPHARRNRAGTGRNRDARHVAGPATASAGPE